MVNTTSRTNQNLFFYLPLTLMFIWTIFPIYWTINTAFKHEGDIMKRPLGVFAGSANC